MSRFVSEYSFDPPLMHTEEGAIARDLRAGVRTSTDSPHDCLVDLERRHMLWSAEGTHSSLLDHAFDRPGIELIRHWTGNVYVPRRLDRVTGPSSEERVDVVGERTFDTPITLDELAALERSCAWCSESHRVQLVRLVLAHDGRRAIALCRAPDAESVRLAYRRAALVDRVWACRRIPLPAPVPQRHRQASR